MADLFVTIATSATTSAAFTFAAAPRPMAVFVPSLSPGCEVRIQFAPWSGVSFADLVRADGSALPWTVYSGAGPAVGIVPFTASPWVTISLPNVPQTSVRTFTISPLNAR